jgi:hypothetical protein
MSTGADAGAVDGGSMDASVEDAASPSDVARNDVANGADASMDGAIARTDAAADARTPGMTNPGCGCRVPSGGGHESRRSIAWLAACAAVMAERRRRRSA